jgi:hypothetical protein
MLFSTGTSADTPQMVYGYFYEQENCLLTDGDHGHIYFVTNVFGVPGGNYRAQDVINDAETALVQMLRSYGYNCTRVPHSREYYFSGTGVYPHARPMTFAETDTQRRGYIQYLTNDFGVYSYTYNFPGGASGIKVIKEP